MKRKFKEIARVTIATMAAVGIFGSALLGANTWTLQAATAGETYVPPAVEDVSIPDNPVPEEAQALGLTVINITDDAITIPSTALSMEEAVQVGARYIMDVFGADIDGMYIDFEFSDWDHMTRSLWFGIVSSVYRNTRERNQRLHEFNDAFLARINAGEDPDVLGDDWHSFDDKYPYIPGYFYFFIDAITGERIDIWRPSPSQHRWRAWSAEHSNLINEYVEHKWGGDWGAALSREITPATIDEYSLIAAAYAQRHFNNSTVVNVEFNDVSTSLVVGDNRTVEHVIFLAFIVTDDTGRAAGVLICKDNRMVISIHTNHNDVRPMELIQLDDWDWVELDYVLDDGSTVIRRGRIDIDEDDDVARRRARFIESE
ncbi:MAG: hypothetical protein FWC73_08565 [Defluviitaleaceae bacterium]|nr:hypothetical protein [Defluviitaleaceae bacterium]